VPAQRGAWHLARRPSTSRGLRSANPPPGSCRSGCAPRREESRSIA